MNTIFQNIKGYEEHTLYILGNGFDLLHNLPTSYQDFYKWLKMMKQNDFINKMEELFPCKSERNIQLWNDFEIALGKYDLHSIYERYTPKPTGGYIKDMELYARQAIEPVINKIQTLIFEWAKSISLDGARPMKELPSNARYLTFNYTLTLENVYHVPQMQILHIHNSIDKEKVIVGNDVWQNRWITENRKLQYEEEQSQKELIDVLNTLYKNPEEIIRSNQNFFSCLKDIKYVVVLGHSLSSIDMPYFREIRNRISPNSHWYISKHSPQDDERVQNFINVITYGPYSTSKDNIHVFDF